MNEREKLIELLRKVQDYGTKHTSEEWSVTVECKDNEKIADHLIAHGVTVQEWIPVTERLPEEDVAFIHGAKFDPNESAKYCTGFEPITNADRIRAMSDEELVKFIGHNSLCDQIQNDHGAWCKKQRACESCLVEWLKKPAEEEK